MKRKILATLLAFASVATFAFGITGCTENNPDDSGKNEHTVHTFNNQAVEEKYLKTPATCQAKAEYFLSCECGEKGTETFESGELKAHNYKDGACTVCKQPDPDYKRKTITLEEWKKACDLRNYDNCDSISAVFGKTNTSESYGNGLRRIDGDKAYTAYVNLEISEKAPFEILSKPPYEVVQDQKTGEKYEYYFANKNSDEAFENLRSYENYLANMFDKFTFDEETGAYVWECKEDTTAELPDHGNLDKDFWTTEFFAGNKITAYFENGKIIRLEVDMNSSDQAMIILYTYGSTEITLP